MPKTISRQFLTARRLNQRTKSMRSRIYKLTENVSDNKFFEERDIGDLPWSWGDFGYKSDVQYLHSTVRGFNQDYKQLTQQLNINNHIQSTAKNLTTLLQKEKNILRKVAERDKIRFFGAKNANTPLKDTEYVQSLIQGIDASRTNSTQVQTIVQEMKNASNWYTWEGAVLSQLKQQYDSGNHSQVSRDSFYQNVVDYIWETWQNFLSLPLENIVAPQDAQNLLNKIKDKKITKQTIANWVRSKHASKNTPFGFAKELGYVYEDAIRESVTDYSIRKASNLIAERIGQRNGLVDVALYNKGKAHTSITIDDLDRFTGGISAKLRYNNTFSIEVAGTPNEFFQIAGADFEAALQALRYLYNNWMALSVYNTDQNRAYSNKGQTRTRKAATLLEGGHLLSRSFQGLSQVANLILLQSAFFANAKDVNDGNVSLFNQQYWDNLIAQLDRGQMTIPAFVFSTNDYYETWKIVDYYLSSPLITANELFGTKGFLNTQNSYNAGLLKKLYDAKARVLKDKSRKYFDLPLYDVIHQNVASPLQAAFVDSFETVLHTNRRLSIKFRLIASDQLN